ncbi:hypothetical protein O7621_03185 [Solwaraspora sp. WMMD937]|uniref:hypothetical protein n=1 Tax=Solwaraspora sp. WMMD937 TaxID=3016090 RepID=UPI00249BD4BF|nr:hypothetical protein [Solwaraspora sp. WMMD937]WFE22370.1 hypothetical protein O7621_03185 [Solwaraspora sp. WMMD937]
MIDDRSGGPVPDDGLPAETRQRMIELLAAEFGAAWQAAVTGGADLDGLAEYVDDRRRTVESIPEPDDRDDCR